MLYMDKMVNTDVMSKICILLHTAEYTAVSCVHACLYIFVGLAAVIKAELVEEAGSLVEPQRGNEKNKQPLPVPLLPEISNTPIPPTITTSVRKDKQ